jgi:soluble P-type ATPase
MSVQVEIPGRPALDLHYLLLDVNGTLTDRGVLLEGVQEPLRRIDERLDVRLLSADTFGTLGEVAAELGLSATLAATAEAKRRAIASLGGHRCAAIGNGANDVPMLSESRTRNRRDRRGRRGGGDTRSGRSRHSLDHTGARPPVGAARPRCELAQLTLLTFRATAVAMKLA